MANIKSAKKRVRQNEKRRLHNRYYAKTARNAIRDLRAETDYETAVKMMVEVTKKLDKLVKMRIIHRNKAANLKQSLQFHVNSLAPAAQA